MESSLAKLPYDAHEDLKVGHTGFFETRGCFFPRKEPRNQGVGCRDQEILPKKKYHTT